MQDAFIYVLVAVVVVGVVCAALSFVGRADALERMGKGGMALRDGSDRPREPEPAGKTASAVAEEEVRQMVRARNARRARRGEAPLDVEAEVAALTRPAAEADAGLAAEVRQLVEARNARRVRRGEEPLDVDAEVARQLADLGG